MTTGCTNTVRIALAAYVDRIPCAVIQISEATLKKCSSAYRNLLRSATVISAINCNNLLLMYALISIEAFAFRACTNLHFMTACWRATASANQTSIGKVS
jgi:hypothetical protein